MGDNSEYILGINQTELERLEFQHSVWKKVTDKFFDRIGIQKGWKCLDVGAGPGLVTSDLLQRVGELGEVTALEPSEFYLSHFKEKCKTNNWTNVKFIQGNLEDTDLEDEHYDFIFLRWVIDFVPEPENFLLKLFASLKKGGVIALQDYVYQGVFLYPNGGAFDNIDKAVRDYWKLGNGDPYFPVKLPAFFKNNKIRLSEFTPIGVAGDSESNVIEWAHKFFMTHIQIMADKKIITQDEADAFLEDWLKHRNHPDTIFISPPMVDVAGVKL